MVLSGCIENSLTLDDEFPVHPVTANWRWQNLDNDNASRERTVSSGDTDALNAVTAHPLGICSSLAISALALKVTEALKMKEAPSVGSVCAPVPCPPVTEPPSLPRIFCRWVSHQSLVASAVLRVARFLRRRSGSTGQKPLRGGAATLR
jgi:hypothetical protein